MEKEKLSQLLALDVTGYTEKKNGLTYLSWASAWREFVKVYPDATYTIQKRDDGLPCFGNSELGYMCYTTVTAGETTHEMWLPVLDFRNKSMTTPTSFDINKTVMRCLTKNLAMFGLGLYIYSKDDAPEAPSGVDDAMIEEKLSYLKKVKDFYIKNGNDVKSSFVMDMIESADFKHYQRVMDTYKVDSAKKVLAEDPTESKVLQQDLLEEEKELF